MFNLSILTTRPRPFAFRQMGSLYCVQRVRMLDICLVRQKLQVLQPVIVALKIFMVYLQTAFNRTVKGLPHDAVHTLARVHSIFTKCDLRVVVAVKRHLTGTYRLITPPRFALFDRHDGRNAGVQKRRDVCQFNFRRQHLLGFLNLLRGKSFAARYSTNAAKIANLVNAFVFENRFPLFHSPLRLTYTQFNCTYVKGQAR